jgi:hypothetical protein
VIVGSGVAVFVGSAKVTFADVPTVVPEGSRVVELVSAVPGALVSGIPSTILKVDEVDVACAVSEAEDDSQVLVVVDGGKLVLVLGLLDVEETGNVVNFR